MPGYFCHRKAFLPNVLYETGSCSSQGSSSCEPAIRLEESIFFLLLSPSPGSQITQLQRSCSFDPFSGHSWDVAEPWLSRGHRVRPCSPNCSLLKVGHPPSVGHPATAGTQGVEGLPQEAILIYTCLLAGGAFFLACQWSPST